MIDLARSAYYGGRGKKGVQERADEMKILTRMTQVTRKCFI